MHADLSEEFSGVLTKELSSVECVGAKVSRQQEIHAAINGRGALGEPDDKVPYDARFLYVTDDRDEWQEHDGVLTYADARRKNPARRPEWRLTYRRENNVMLAASPGDRLWLARHRSRPRYLLVVVAAGGSQVESQLGRLLGQGASTDRPKDFVALAATGAEGPRTFEDAELLEFLGVEVRPEEDDLDRLVALMGDKQTSLRPDGWPTTKDFSALCREVSGGIDHEFDADSQLVHWFERTNALFFAYERVIVQQRLDDAFAMQPSIDIDRFLEVSKSILNSRKSRAGTTFEHHLAALFRSRGVSFESLPRRALADGSRPDFVFPEDGVADDFTLRPDAIVLGAKTTLKERWRQVVGEAGCGIRYVASMDVDITPSLVRAMQQQSVVPVIGAAYVPSDFAERDRVYSYERFIRDVAPRGARS